MKPLAFAIFFFVGWFGRELYVSGRIPPETPHNSPSTRPASRDIHEAQGELYRASQAIDRASRNLQDAQAKQ